LPFPNVRFRQDETELHVIDNKPNARDRKALKQQYLDCFSGHTTNVETWRETVMRLIQQGVSRGTLLNWAVDAGHPKITVSSVLSRILVSLGLRERREGAGRKPSPEALELLAHARNRYGGKFLNVLRAAWRAGKAHAVGDIPRESPHRGKIATIVGPQLGSLKTATPRPKAWEARPGRKRRQSLRAVFKSNFNGTKTVRTKTRSQ
jgi:hypothetical protein